MKRREFISKSIKSLAGLSALTAAGTTASCKQAQILSHAYKNPFMSSGKPILIIVRGKNIKAMIHRGLNLLFETAESPLRRSNIFIKPNATWMEPYPATSRPATLKEIASFFQTSGSCEIKVGDNPSARGIAVKSFFRKIGYYRLEDSPDLKILPRNPSLGFSYRRVKNSNWSANPTIMVNKDLLDADLVINTAIPKRHHEADFTCALKNNFGAVYDSFRTLAHLKMMKNKDEGEGFFDRTIAECADAARPHVNIIDARSILTKSGPGLYAGGEVKSNIDELILSGDMVLVDAYCGGLMRQHDPTFRPEKRLTKQLKYAQKLGLGVSDFSCAEVIEVSL